MKRMLLIMTVMLSSLTIWAQSPPAFNYQAVVRDAAGQTLPANTNVKVRFIIHNGSAIGPVEFMEVTTAVTNQFGLITLVVGQSANLGEVDWASGTKWLQVEIDAAGGNNFTDMGTSQLLSVPYALYAANGIGATGPQGPAGANGTNGLDGATGPQGPQGIQGVTGPQGPAGIDGVNGLDGAAGLQGPQGIQGETGPQGPAGVDGVNGTNGLDGATGPQGPQGIQGETGPQGPAGVDGVNGTNGLDGATGSQGPQGIQGETGPQGPAGVDGVNGTNGLDGATGPQGPQGIQGETGPQGPAGVDGVNGTNGLDGATGPQGPQGIQGETGPQGPAGVDGVNGLDGAIGPQGPVGATGADGLFGGDSHAFMYESNNSVTPQSGHITFDDDNTPISFIYISKINASGTDLESWITAMTASTNTIKGRLRVFQANNASNFVVLNVYDIIPVGGAGYQLVISYVNGNSLIYPTPHFTNNQPIVISFSASGDAGATGPQGPAGVDGTNGLDGATGATGLLSSGSAAGNTPYWNGSEWVVGSSNIYNNGGNVGIGNNSPSYPLHIGSVQGSAGDSKIALSTGNAGGGNHRTWSIGTQFGDNDVTAPNYGFYIRDETDNENALVITMPDGFVGIGTSNPEALLHVNGTFKLNDGTEAAGKVLTSDANGNATWQSLPVTADGTPDSAYTAAIKSSFALSGGGTVVYNTGSELSWSNRFIVICNGNGGHFSTDGYFDIQQPANGTLIPVVGGGDVTVSATGILLTGWQALYYILPIGSSAAPLDANFRIVNYNTAFVLPENWVLIGLVNGDDQTIRLGNGAILQTGRTWAQGLGTAQAGSADFIHNSTTTQSSTNFNIGGNGMVNGTMAVGNYAGAKLTVVEGGSDPSAYTTGKALYVTGNYGSGQTYDGGVEFRHDNNTQGIGFGYNSIYATGSDNDQVLNLIAKGNAALTLQAHGGATGYVGVGTSNPQVMLDVNGSFSTNGNSSVSGNSYVGSNMGVGILTDAKLTVVAGGTDPSAYTTGKALYVTGNYGSGQSNDGGVEFRHDNNTQGIGFGYNTIYASGTDTDQHLNLTAKGAGHITLQAYNGATGNVGVGIANPGSLLHVNGNVTIGNTVTSAKLTVGGGDIYVENNTNGVVMKSPNGSCWRMTVDDSGAPVFSFITCP